MKKIYNLTILVATVFIVASCSRDSGYYGSADTGSSEGKGGSMARFCIVGDNLFTVDRTSLNMFDISSPEDPVLLSGRTQQLDFGIETIFPMDSLLFIGSQTGMYIFYVSKYGFPQHLSTATHIRSCDPVVAQEQYAYVTLNSNNTGCGRTTNVLQIYDVADLTRPELIKEVIGFTSPLGLGIDGNRLFICDKGLKVYDITDRISPLQIADLHSAGVHDVSDAYDVIPFNGLLILVASSGIYQFDYAGESLNFLSKLEVAQKK
jgi:hypothetical protein